YPGSLRGPPAQVTTRPTNIGQADEPLDARTGRRGQFRPRAHPPARQRRSHSGGPPPLAGVVEAGETLDHESRSGVCPKKKRRDQLVQRAMVHPSCALGFGCEVWGSRLAQPNPHGWTDAETSDKVQERSRPPDDPDPKALACYGLLLRPGPLQADQMWLRFVTGRPVSAVTIEFLAWWSAALGAYGLHAVLLI